VVRRFTALRLRALASLLLALERRRIAHPKLGLRRFSKSDYSRVLRPAKWGSGVSVQGSNPEPLMSALSQKRHCTPARRLHGADESRLALHGASSGGAAMIASKSDHICGEIGGGGLDYPRRRLARRPPSAIGLGTRADAYGHAILVVPTS
jgi:hypothetical protein